MDAYGLAPDMLIVLDRSLSMLQGLRWDPSKQAVKTITSEFEGLIAFGLEYFPGGDLNDIGGLLGAGNLGGLLGGAGTAGAADLGGLLGGGATAGAGNFGGLFGGGTAGGAALACGGAEKIDVPLMRKNAGPIATSVDATFPNGFTPTGPALTVALQALGDRRLQLDQAVKPAYVLLVTDGDPRCGVADDPAQQESARAAVKALKSANIPTYVFGYQIDAAYQPLMNELAMLGGTQR
ncbi:MAG TPA: vWA domain-containing protein, partial [Polyangiales bacterium]